MRIQHVAQAATSWPDASAKDRKAGASLSETIERIKWRLWHGQVRGALDLITETMATLEATAQAAPPAMSAALKVTRLLGELETYVCGQSDIIIDYATARRREEPISTAVTESTVQWLVHRRMNAQQQMRWTPRGAHLMLKVRCAVMNGSLQHDHAVAEGRARRPFAARHDPPGLRRSPRRWMNTARARLLRACPLFNSCPVERRRSGSLIQSRVTRSSVSSVRRSMGVSATACAPSRESAGYGLLVSKQGDRWYWLSMEDHQYREADDRNHQS
jgi:hypothetical protein